MCVVTQRRKILIELGKLLFLYIAAVQLGLLKLDLWILSYDRVLETPALCPYNTLAHNHDNLDSRSNKRGGVLVFYSDRLTTCIFVEWHIIGRLKNKRRERRVFYHQNPQIMNKLKNQVTPNLPSHQTRYNL